MININKWNNYNFQDLNLDTYRQCLTFSYCKCLEPMEMFIENKEKKIHDMRKSAECHKLVRRDLQHYLKPGLKIYDICTFIENKICEHFNNNNLECGIGFPVSFSINNCAAHDTAKPGDNRVITESDVVKIDYGTHVNGYITDSAFTMCFDPVYKNLLKATEDATWTGIKLAGPDAVINDISKEINEVINSYEVEINGKMYPVKTIKALGGHNIEPYTIHGGQLILCAPSDNPLVKNTRMKSNTCYAIETFGSVLGTGNLQCDNTVGNTDLFMINKDMKNSFVNLKLDISKKMLYDIKKTRSTLPFCSRWLNDTYGIRYRMGLKELSDNNLINLYPPLCDIKGSKTSQLEHTIFLHDYGKEVLSAGDDY